MTQITVSSRDLCGLPNQSILRITYCGQIAFIKQRQLHLAANLCHLRNLRIYKKFLQFLDTLSAATL